MNAEDTGSSQGQGIRYTQHNWGDLIEGTKEQLQDLGLGVACAFPGEVGGPRKELKVRDPRGYAVTISNQYCRDNRYSASLTFPGWPVKPEKGQWQALSNGLKKRQYTWFDEYMGSAEALAAEGLVRLDQLPGQPGRRKTTVIVFPDGSIPSGAPTANHGASHLPGAKRIERASSSSYRVRVVVTETEELYRRAADKLAEQNWLQQISERRRPEKLRPMNARSSCTSLRATSSDLIAPKTRGHLQLVWSSPHA